MRRARLHEFITELITNTWTDNDAVLDDQDAFGALYHHLNQAGDGDAHGIEQAWTTLVDSLSDTRPRLARRHADNHPRRIPGQQTRLGTHCVALRRRASATPRLAWSRPADSTPGRDDPQSGSGYGVSARQAVNAATTMGVAGAQQLTT